MRKTILFIRSGGKHNTSRLEKAKRLGNNIAIAELNYKNENNLADYILDVDTNNLDALITRVLALHRQNPISGVISFSEAGVESATIIAEVLNLKNSNTRATRICRNKFLTRLALEQKHIKQPQFQLFYSIDEIEPSSLNFKFPIIIKPLKLSGACSVFKLNSKEELNEIKKRIKKIHSNHSIHNVFIDTLKDYWLAEEYIAGFEISVDSISFAGKTHILLINDKMIPVEGPDFYEQYFVSPSDRINQELEKKIAALTTSVLNAVGYDFGLSHTEFRINSHSEIFPLEINARQGGGLIPEAILFSKNIDIYELMIKLVMDEKISITSNQSKPIAIRIIYSPAGKIKKINGLDQLEKAKELLLCKIWKNEGEIITSPQTDYAMGFMMTGNTGQDAFLNIQKYGNFIKYITE